MTLVAVDRDVLDQLFYYCAQDMNISWMEPSHPLVVLAVQAGLPIAGSLKPGTVPPAPPPYLGRLTAPTYRGEKDHRLRCADCGKVVYGNSAQAGKASALITTDRQAMRTYLGPCGHYHLSRVKGDRR